jgi:hypothetical protein
MRARPEGIIKECNEMEGHEKYAEAYAELMGIMSSHDMIEGSLEVKLPTIWTDEKQSREEAERRQRLAQRRLEEKE